MVDQPASSSLCKRGRARVARMEDEQMRMLEGGDEPGPETLPVVRGDLVNGSLPILDGERALRITAVGTFDGAPGNLSPGSHRSAWDARAFPGTLA